MKIYKLEIYKHSSTEQVEVKAEAHTFDNNMIMFWTKNPAQEWAMVCAYPTNMTAIVFYDELPAANNINLSDFVEVSPEIPTMSTKKRSKK